MSGLVDNLRFLVFLPPFPPAINVSDCIDTFEVRPIQTVTLSFFRFDGAGARLWALWMMGAARRPMSRIAGLEFWKLCGSGGGEGFTPRVNIDVVAILCVWSDRDTAERRLASEPVFTRYRNRAAEDWTVYLEPISARGLWSGVRPFDATERAASGPIATLTRATIRPSIMMQFWKRVPDISAVIGRDPNVAFKIGIGEVPLFQQVTFSIWPNTDSISAFARDVNGPHAQAIRAVRDGKWFSEELYARFRVIGDRGNWNGARPLKHLGVE